MNSLLCLFQCKNKFCSNTLCTDHIDVLSMCMKNLFDDCQTKAGSFLILASGSINLKIVPRSSGDLPLEFQCHDL